MSGFLQKSGKCQVLQNRDILKFLFQNLKLYYVVFPPVF